MTVRHAQIGSTLANEVDDGICAVAEPVVVISAHADERLERRKAAHPAVLAIGRRGEREARGHAYRLRPMMVRAQTLPKASIVGVGERPGVVRPEIEARCPPKLPEIQHGRRSDVDNRTEIERPSLRRRRNWNSVRIQDSSPG